MGNTTESNRMTSPTHYVGIGASAGGLEAIDSFFANMRPQNNLAFIVIQHLSPDHKSLMVELLSKKTEMPVHRAEEGMRVQANHVYLIPPKKNLTIFHGELMLTDQDSCRGINLPIDVFFRSLADDAADKAVAVVLSGTGSDGTRGVRAVKEAGGMVMVQSPESAKFDGMPRAAISTGVADFVLPPEEMPEQLLAFASHSSIKRTAASNILLGDEDGLTRIFAELRGKTKVDFTYYKPSTITRRLERRMTVNQIDEISDYVRYIQTYPGELMTLYRELLIGVTSFFRDPEAMEFLRSECLPELLMRVKDREVRFWIAGCSTGEEAYTFAILAKEAMERQRISRDIKIFATDIDRDAILRASTGSYPESIAADLDPGVLAKYFYNKEGVYQIARHIREMVVFAQHNLVKDPPFTNIDLISCRNLLIYFQPVLQQKALEMFNFSLNPQGVLFLGTSESIGDMAACFETVHQKYKIYRSQGKALPPGQGKGVGDMEEKTRRIQPFFVREKGRQLAQPDDSRLLSRLMDVASNGYMPLSVIVNEQLEIIHIVGDPSPYFKVPTGRTAFDITKMASKDLAIPLATGIQKVFRTRDKVIYNNVLLHFGQEAQTLRLNILPLPEQKGADSLAAVFIEEVDKKSVPETRGDGEYDLGKETEQRIRDLEQELQFARENLQATIEELETSNEELQATNEELLASNEELQSTNEELQSTNEELYTVNAEFQKKIMELTELHNDVDNLLTSSGIGTLLLDEDLEIRRFSPEISRLFNIMESDVGRPLTHLSHRLMDFDPLEVVRKVQVDNKPRQLEVKSEEGKAYLARVIPYTIGVGAFSGLVMTFVDISTLASFRKQLNHIEQTSQNIQNFMPVGLFVYAMNDHGELILESGNPEAEKLTGISVHDWKGNPFESIWPQAGALDLTERFLEVMRTGKSYAMEDLDYRDARIQGAYSIQAFRVPENRLAVMFQDVTEQKKMESDLVASESKYRKLFETMAQGVVYQDKDGNIISANPSAERILGLTLDQMLGRTSMDPRWQAIKENGEPLVGQEHPAMVALATGKPVMGYIMGVNNSQHNQTRWIMVNSTPEFLDGETEPYQVFSTFDDVTDKINLQRGQYDQ
ncbi:MCP methyltransferase/methylesterase CheR/CheB with PAS/PAC sensor [Desulfatibacillum aliphaticivorans]|uniref:MCP methyltransferase/methylesterase CheR/CheB with PAS/PAC sensor n=1 Tax=Desulfatibacillum aliphaticivorans TaxID=218208 RepID=B8FDZ1_DESAL|nr:chemotaxis protein CheB [Desulfatibacillum aliphaticivorans]ACL06772.1 MCP methyltransferase/methylesterase CheR/CheB with PAS/PAC sensor [Desulfatibacillum aliphaticivorans]